MTKLSKAVVTGGAGFIGSHIVDELVRRGVETIVLDDLSTGSRDNLRQHSGSKSLRVEVGDIKNIARLLHADRSIDVVFHEAAIASVPLSVEAPMRVHETNVTSTLEVLNFCVTAKVKRLVFASSAAVYGAIDGKLATEEMQCRPSSPYGASKLAVEDYLSSYQSSYALETVALRYFNVYGPRQAFNNGYTGVISVFANQLLQGMTPTIFGDGMQTRDFVNVRDIVRANLLAAESSRSPGGRFNVATGRSVSILELLESLKEVTGHPDIEPKFLEPRVGDVRSGSASISKIRSDLGFEPSVALHEGLSDLVASIRSPSGGVALGQEQRNE